MTSLENVQNLADQIAAEKKRFALINCHANMIAELGG